VGGIIFLFFDFHVNENIRLIGEAERLGFTGLAFFNPENTNSNQHNGLEDRIVKEDHSIEIYNGVAIRAKNPEQMKNKVGKFRKEADVILVLGGDQKINRAACEDPRVDIIAQPYRNRRDCGINHVIGKKAAENRVAVELNIRYLSKTSSYLRYKVLAYFREILKLKRKYDFPLIITSDARTIFDQHSPQDIIALSRCFGMDRQESLDALSKTPLDIIERNKIRDNIIANGVKLIK
jgi:ribonuclease P/MRP protein subunit RPP1